MKLRKRVPKRTLKRELEDLLVEMDLARQDNLERYKVLCDEYERLEKAASYKRGNRFQLLGSITGVVGSLLSVGAILWREELRVFPTKAWSLVQKIRY